MPDKLQDVDLSCYSFDVGDFVDFLFLQELDCHFLLGVFVDAESYFSEGALSEGFTWIRGWITDDEIANLFGFLGLLGYSFVQFIIKVQAHSWTWDLVIYRKRFT